MSAASDAQEPRPASAAAGTGSPHWLASLEKTIKSTNGGKEEISKLDSAQKVNHLLEQRSRLLSMTIRLMEQQRQYFRAIEAEREAAYAKLEATIELVQETSRTAYAATESDAKPGDAGIDAMFEKNRKALDELDNVSIILRTNYLCWRSAWEQFAGTRERGKTIRAEMADVPEY